jgi:hypothetical protein
MKKIITLFILLVLSISGFAIPPTSDLSGILSETGLNFDLTLPGENGVKVCAGDFNNDGKKDFIINGLHTSGETTKAFLRIYTGQATGAPTLAYQDDEYSIAGNGAIDCYQISEDSYLVAIQGGAIGNWTNPFTANVYKLTYASGTFELSLIQNLTTGAGRGSILFLDSNNDGYVDIFQNGWSNTTNWTAQSNLYINDGNNHFADAISATGIPAKANLTTIKGDINNDGKIDLAYAAQSSSGGAYVFINNGDNTFTQQTITDFTAASIGGSIEGSDDSAQLLLIDFNNDKYMDAVVTYSGTYSNPWDFALKIFKNNGDGTFTKMPQTTKSGDATTFVGGQHGDIVSGDFNQDGNEDLIIGMENASDGWKCKSYILYGNGLGGYDQYDITALVTPMCRRGNFGRFLVADFNGDSKPDLLVAGSTYYATNAGVHVFNNVAASFSTSTRTQFNKPIIKVYSNNNQIIVENAPLKSYIVLLNTAGEKIYSTIINDKITSINLKAKPGLYFIMSQDSLIKILIK